MKKFLTIALCELLVWSQSFCATTNKMSYGTSNQAITIASSIPPGYSTSASIDNTTNLFLDALVSCDYKTGAVANSTHTLIVYAYGTTNGGTWYTDNVGGSSATVISSSNTANARIIGVIVSTTASTSASGGPWSVANAFGGVLPAKWGITINNPTSQATVSASTGCWYQGIQIQNQ